jgi:hypothetical protein
MLDDLKQVLGSNEEPPQSGVYTVEYLCERVLNEGDSKQWLSWLWFCNKWEKAGYGSTAVFLAFPDLAKYFHLPFSFYLELYSLSNFAGGRSCPSRKCSLLAGYWRSS